MIDIPKLIEDVPPEVERATDKMLNPTCPRFPEFSVFLGKLASWLYCFAAWVGARPRLWGSPLLALCRRRDAVAWARLSYMERVVRLSMCTVASALILIPLFGGGPRTVRPGPSLRAS